MISLLNLLQRLSGSDMIYLLTDEKYDGVLNYPVIKINFLPISPDFRGIDFLLFTSKNGVRAVERVNDEWKKIPSLVIGDGTKEEVLKRGGKIEYVAKNSYGDEFAKEIDKKYKGKNILFFRAKNIISNIAFKNNILKEVIAYETKCNKPKNNLKKPSIIIFSSPSTVKCFSKIEDFKGIIPVAIGKKTKKTLLNYFKEEEIFMPSKPSIKKCIELAKSLYSNNQKS